MAAPTPGPSTSRRPRAPGQGEMSVGSFRRLEEIGKGSFATVYKATYSVRSPISFQTLPSFGLDLGLGVLSGTSPMVGKWSQRYLHHLQC